MTDAQISELEQQLFNAVTSGEQIRRILDGIARQTGWSIVSLNDDFALDYYSAETWEEAPFRDFVGADCYDCFVTHRRLTPELLQQNSRLRADIVRLLQTGSSSLAELPGHPDRHLAFIPLTESRAVNGILCILFRDREDQAAILRIFRWLSRLYFRDSSEEALSSGTDLVEAYAARDLFSDHVDLRRSLYWELYQTARGKPSFAAEPYFCIAVFQPLPSASRPQLQELRSRVKTLRGSGFTYGKNGLLYALFSGQTAAPEEREAFRADLLQLCHVHHAVCALSQPFSSLENKNGHIRQAENALRTASDVPGVVDVVQNYASLLADNAVQKFGHDFLLPAEFRALMRSDTENGTQYLETLVVYLKNDNRLSDAARELYLDRNTVKYRLSKISELLSLDLDDSSAALRLKFAALILESDPKK